MFRQGQPQFADDEIKEPRYYKLKPFVQVFGTPAFVVMIGYPLEIIMMNVQMRRGMLCGFTGNPYFWLGTRHAYVGGVLKNGSLGVREPVIEGFESVALKKSKMLDEDVALREDEAGLRTTNLTVGQRALAVVGGSGVISAFDHLTQYSANRRLHAQQGIAVPPFKNMMEVLRYIRAGLMARWARNWWGAGFFLGSENLVRPIIARFLPKSRYSNAEVTAISTVGTAVPAGFVTMGWDRVWREVVLKMDMKTFRVPTMRQAMYSIYAKDGLRGFVRGASWNALTITAIFGAINVFDEFIIKRVFPPLDNKRLLRDTPLAPKLFTSVNPAPQTVTITELPDVSPELRSENLAAKL